MPNTPAFEVFEAICQELASRDAAIIPVDDLSPTLLEDLKDYYAQTADLPAFERALADIAGHFASKGSLLPFSYETATGRFKVIDKDYVEFIAFAANSRGLGGKDAKDFECQTTARLSKRLTGALHCIGTPRGKYPRKSEFVKYLVALGFDGKCLEPRDKDGGLDIIWLPPLGTVPLRPVVSLQCKNSSFNLEEANRSVGRASTTLQRHSHVRGHNGLYFVVFNDYIDGSYLGRATGWAFIPLGLSDLGSVTVPLEEHIL